MFNFQMELSAWNGEHMTLIDLQKRLSQLRLEHLGEIAPEIGVRELLLLGMDRHWIVERRNGDLVIQVPQTVNV